MEILSRKEDRQPPKLAVIYCDCCWAADEIREILDDLGSGARAEMQSAEQISIVWKS